MHVPAKQLRGNPLRIPIPLMSPLTPTRPLSTGPAPPRPGTATVPWRPCTAPHSRASTLPIAHNRHSEHTVRRHTQAVTNDACGHTCKHAAKGPGPRQHAGHAGHQPRAAQTPKPRPPARCRQICLQRSSKLLGRHGDVVFKLLFFCSNTIGICFKHRYFGVQS